MISRYPNIFFFSISITLAIIIFYAVLQLMYYILPFGYSDETMPPGLQSEPLHGDEGIEGPTPKIMLNVINPPGLRYEPLPEGGPGSADLKITDMSVQGNVDPPGPNQIFVVDGNPLSSGPSVEIGEAITLEPLFHMQKSQPIIFFGTTEQDAPLVIHPDGRVLRYGRDLGTDPEIFEALQRALFEGCPPSAKE